MTTAILIAAPIAIIAFIWWMKRNRDAIAKTIDDAFREADMKEFE